MSTQVTIKTTKVADALQKAIQDLDMHSVKVGWFKGDVYPGTGESVAEIAEKNEEGFPAGNIVARPFLRPTIDKQQNAWRLVINGALKKALTGEIEPLKVWANLGEKAQGDFQKAIKALVEPPLRPYTIKKRIEKLAKGTRFAASIEKPLIETGLMLSTLTYEVSEGE
jgi:hypothetical protein